MKFIKENKVQLLLIIFIAFLTWHKILFRVPTGEGYYYFSKGNNIDLKYLSIASILGSYDFLAKAVFTILIPIFRDNISYYMYFQFLIMILVYFTFYLMMTKIFKDKILAVLSTIFFIANYVGSFTMIGQGDYQRFIQRVPNLIPTFLSVLFFVLYIRNKKIKYWIYSFIFFLSAIIMSHYTSFFLPFFIILPFVYTILTKKISFKKSLISAAIFTLATIVITSTDPLSKPAKYSMLQFIERTPKLTEMVLYQIPSSGFPIDFTEFLAKHHSPPIQTPYIQLLLPTFILVMIFLYFGYLKIKKDKDTLAFYLTMIISLFPISFLTMYAYNAIPNPLVNFGEDRIYFIHSIIFAVIWGIIIKTFLNNKSKKFYTMVAVVITILFLLQNIPPIWTSMDKIEYHSKIVSGFLQTMKKLSPQFNEKTIIVAPWEMQTSDALYQAAYNIPSGNFVNLNSSTLNVLAQITKDNNNVFVFDYSYSNFPDGSVDVNSVKIINFTENFRKSKKLDIVH